ncbi:MAG: hypothetical protein GF393_04045 [Armatimonadia bacterium]|nr:hypothetical protein [Armatimonadia bacterium]
MSLTRTEESFAPLFWFKGGYPLTIATTHKTASTTMAHTLGKKGKFNEYREAPKDKPVVLIVRHPLDRLVSAFMWFVRGPSNIIPGGGNRRFGYIDFGQFVRHTETHHNMHWTPQTFQHPRWREYKRLVPLHDLSLWWPADLPPLDHKKKTKRMEWQSYYDDELRDRCEKRYAEDIEAYELACRQGVYTR